MQPVDRITLTFEDNGGLHDDLVLRINDRVWRGDSYFLWCERPHPDTDDARLVKDVLAQLLRQWTDAINGLRNGEVCYLPFAFWDEGSEWLRCTLSGENLFIEKGWSTIEGWAFMPSDVGALLQNVPEFTTDGSTFTISREAMVVSLGNIAA
jgi:hypothetical protein